MKYFYLDKNTYLENMYLFEYVIQKCWQYNNKQFHAMFEHVKIK